MNELKKWFAAIGVVAGLALLIGVMYFVRMYYPNAWAGGGLLLLVLAIIAAVRFIIFR